MTRKLFLVLLSVLLSIPIVRAQSSQTINVQTPGTLASLIEGDKNGVTNLIVTGTINATDFATIKGMAKLSVLNMGGATVDNATIPNQAFRDKQYQSLVLPEGIKTIGGHAFLGSKISKPLILPTSIEFLDSGAFESFQSELDFSGCKGSLTTLGSGVFNNTPFLELDFSAFLNLKTFHRYCFSGYTGHVLLPSNLTHVPNDSFYKFRGSVTLHQGLTSVGGNAFRECNMQELILPEGIKTIGGHAFLSAKIGSPLILPTSIEFLDSGAFESFQSELDFSGCKGSLTTLGSGVFNNTPFLELDFSAFLNLKTFHRYCFSGYTGHVLLPSNLTHVPNDSFYKFRGSVTLHQGLTSVGGNAFRECNMQELILPEGIKTIGGHAFLSAKIGSPLILPTSIEFLDSGAFESFQSELDFSGCKGSLTTLGSGVFNNTPFLELDFSAFLNLKTFHRYCFSGYTGHVLLPSNLTHVPNDSFYKFRGSVTLHQGLTSVGGNAFRECNMQELILPEGIKTIGGHAFLSAKIGSPLILPTSIEFLDSGAFESFQSELDFTGCKGSLTTLGSGVFNNTSFSELDFSAFLNLKTFHRYCFSGYTGHVLLPSNLTHVPNDSFYKFRGSVTLHQGLTSVGGNAFRECNMQELILPEGIKTIGNDAFRSAKIATPLVLPSTLQTIGTGGFADSKIDTFVSLAVTPPALGTNVFAFDKTKCILYVLGESVELYKAANQWKDFLIKPYSNVLTDNMLFEKEDGTNLYEVKINETFKVKVFASMVDSLSLGLYVNDVFFEDIVQRNEDKNTFVCKISSNISDGKYTIQPYMMKDGERKLVSRPLQSHIVDRLPVVVNNWSKSANRAANVNNHMLLDAGVANLLQVEMGKAFKVYLRHTDASVNVKIGLFNSENGTLIADVTESANGDEFTCLISTSKVDANTSYTLIPYNEVSGRISYIERSSEKPYLIDRLPVYVVGSANAFASFAVQEPSVNATFDSSTGMLRFSTQVEKVELYDIMSGSLVKSITVKGNEISIQEVKAGIYVLNIHTTAGKFSQKIKKD